MERLPPTSPPHYCSECPSVGCSKCGMSLSNIICLALSACYGQTNNDVSFHSHTQDYGFVQVPHCEIGASPSPIARGRDCTSHSADRERLRQTGGLRCDSLWESRVSFFGLPDGAQMPRSINTLH